MEANARISEGEPARVYLLFQAGEGQIKTAEGVMIAERF
jgi:hypothetical protein